MVRLTLADGRYIHIDQCEHYAAGNEHMYITADQQYVLGTVVSRYGLYPEQRFRRVSREEALDWLAGHGMLQA